MGKVIRNYDNEGNLISKECTRCHKMKPVSEFYKHIRRVDGLRSECKKCSKEYSKKYNKENKESKKEYDKKRYQENPDKIKGYNKKYRQENKNKIKEYDKKRYQENTQEALQQIKTEVESNSEKYNYIKGKEIYGIIYLIYNTESNKYYVGQTTIGFDNRYPKGWLHEHGYKNAVREDLRLYGENSFEYTKLFKIAHSQYELDKLEAYYIDYFDSYENGYNENRGNILTDRGKEI